MENALFVEATAKRTNTEPMIQYVARKNTPLKELERVECVLPSAARGYLLMQDAGLSPQAWDTMETWLKGSYEYSEIVENLKKLERPLPGQVGTKITGMHGLVETGHSS